MHSHSHSPAATLPNGFHQSHDPSVRKALLSIAKACENSPPLSPVNDWAALCSAAAAHRLMPLAHSLIAASDCPDDLKQASRRQVALLAAFGMAQEREHARALAALAAARVETIVLKGPALARTLYPKSALRGSGDLDVLVRQERWLDAHRALLGAGYTCVQELEAPPPKVAEHKAYYHTQYLSKDRVHMVEVHYDLWWYGLRPALGEQYWQRSIPLEIGGVQTRMVSMEDMLLHLCVHLHHHGYSRLIWFTDLALLIRANPNLHWPYLVQAARTEGLGIFVYYSLLYLERLLDVAAPKWVLQALKPGALQAWVHDRLCPTQTVLEVEVTDRAVFDFHEVPEATELVLNFVLTGRRREKLAYLLHLLAPSDEWLAYFYGTTDPRTLRRRRLLHAPQILSTAAGQLANAAVHGLTRHPVV
jgi:hypothetical protein